MNKKIFNIIFVCVFAALIFGLSAFAWLKPNTAFSEAERRPLETLPELTISSISSGEFMGKFEKYTTDQFPFREKFRSLKAFISTTLLGKMENNQLYTQDGHISKIEYPENPAMIDYAVTKFDSIYNRLLKDTDCSVYLSIVPDKHYFLAQKKGYLSIDYPNFIGQFKDRLPFMEYIDVLPLLSADDYYYTDSHWKQENIQDVAVLLGEKMGANVSAEYTINTHPAPFMGVYAGQSALPTKGDSLNYLTSPTLDECVISYYDAGTPRVGELYSMEKAAGKDPYEMFLSGTMPLVTIENPNATTDKELILFRDSFGSSIAPLFAEGYKKVTVVDIRYLQSDYLPAFIDFEAQDVLFLYSTTLLNNSTALK